MTVAAVRAGPTGAVRNPDRPGDGRTVPPVDPDQDETSPSAAGWRRSTRRSRTGSKQAGRGRRAAIAAGIATFVAATLLALPLAGIPGDDTARPLPVGYFRDRLAGCLPALETETAYLEAGTSRCLRETLLAAEELGNLQTARLDLGQLVEERPWLHNYCHLAEHQVGSLIMQDPSRVPELLLRHPGNTCSWGIGHGLLETFGAARPDDTLWAEVIATCRSLQTMVAPYPEVYALCADGIGHAAWDHHRELRGAVSRCEALVEASAVSSCATGIMMQQYRPAETGKQPELDANDLDGYCASRWPTTLEASIEGCATGIGYVLALSLVSDVVSGALLANGAGDEAQQQAATTGAEGLATATRICGSLGDLAGTCRASLLTNLPTHLLTDPTAWSRLCDGAGEEHRATCETLSS